MQRYVVVDAAQTFVGGPKDKKVLCKNIVMVDKGKALFLILCVVCSSSMEGQAYSFCLTIKPHHKLNSVDINTGDGDIWDSSCKPR